jgi:hypothetical protein
MLAAGTLALAGLSTTAEARHHYRHHHVATHHFGKYLTSRHFHYQHRRYASVRVHNERTGVGVKPNCFWAAASMGGPCGCWAEAMLMGFTDHVRNGINWWLAADWLGPKFQRVNPAPGTVAVFVSRGGRAYHVAPVKAVSADGKTAILHDSWKIHPVRTAGLIFVQPPAVGVPLHRPLIRWMSDPPL